MSFDGFVTKILDALFEKKKNTDEEFCLFCRTASPQEIQNAISSGANINGRNEFGGTPLMCAAVSNENVESIQTLLHSGAGLADIDLRKLFMDDMIDEAIRNGTDPNQNHDVQPILSYFVLEHRSAPVISLLKAGAKPNLIYTDSKGRKRTPFSDSLHMARKYADIKELHSDKKSRPFTTGIYDSIFMI